MTDNFAFTEGSGKTGAADEIGGVLYPRVKMNHGADGSATDVSTASPMPAQLRDSDGTDVALSAKLGSLTETAPATDTASSGLNGRLQRIAQRITSLIALVPAALTGSGNFKVSLQESNASQAVTEADGANVTLGAKADAKSTATDTTAISAMSVWKQISASVQTIATAIAGTLTISGTVTANLAAGTNNIGDVDVVSSALPTGASTLAEQQTQTTHLATIAADTTDIETAVELLDDTVATFGTTTYTEAATKGLIIGAVRRDADTTLVDTTNEVAPLQVDANGRLKTEVFSGETLPVSLASVPSHAVTNAGTFATQVDGAALTALQKIDDPVLVDDATFTPATSSVMMAGFEADESSTDSVDEGDAGAARMTLDRKQIVTPQPHTAGGLSIFRSLDIDESEEEIKGTAGQVYGMWVTNKATAVRYVKFYNATAANVTVGTTTPVITIGIPGNSSDNVAGLFSSTMGIAFDTAITVAATTGLADNDTGAPGANDVIINVFYK